MAQHYSNPKRADDPYALPDVETFYVTRASISNVETVDLPGKYPGWYWQACFPGCLPDSDPVGPFATEAEALADAQDTED